MAAVGMNRHASIGAGIGERRTDEVGNRTMQKRGIEEPMEIAVARDLEQHIRHALAKLPETPSAICIRSAGASSSSGTSSPTRERFRR